MQAELLLERGVHREADPRLRGKTGGIWVQGANWAAAPWQLTTVWHLLTRLSRPGRRSEGVTRVRFRHWPRRAGHTLRPASDPSRRFCTADYKRAWQATRPEQTAFHRWDSVRKTFCSKNPVRSWCGVWPRRQGTAVAPLRRTEFIPFAYACQVACSESFSRRFQSSRIPWQETETR
jgi:hypothetical protein